MFAVLEKNMFAVLELSGKQYRVAKDTIITTDRLEGEKGEKKDFSSVLLIEDKDKTSVGTPTVKGAQVTAEILEQKKADKIIVFKKKRRHNYRRKHGHRQHVTVLKITDIKNN